MEQQQRPARRQRWRAAAGAGAPCQCRSARRAALVLGAFLLASAASLAAAANVRPTAPHKSVTVGADTAEELITLRGYDKDGDKLTYTITSLPARGSLWQLSQVFSTHGYEPKTGHDGKITAPGTVVTGSGHRLVYKPEKTNQPPNGAWDRFEYTVHDGSLVSGKGIVALTGSDKALVLSDFMTDGEGWVVTDNGMGGVGVHHEQSSRGQDLNYFIYSMEDEQNIDANGNDRNVWYFEAPAKFLGNMVHAYGGSLDFTNAAFSGDFGAGNRNFQSFVEGKDGEVPVNLVVLECATCDQHNGVQLAWRADGTFDGQVKKFSLSLLETAGWLQNPKNDLEAWGAPTKCTFIEVLAGLSRIRILGDHTRWHESLGMDNVALTHGGNRVGKPKNLKCYCANPGTDCPALA